MIDKEKFESWFMDNYTHCDDWGISNGKVWFNPEVYKLALNKYSNK